MLGRFAFAAVWIACVCHPALGGNSAFDEAIAKAARISGRWEAALDQAQSPVFAPDSVSRLILNITTRTRRDGEQVDTQLLDVQLEVELNWGLASPFYERIYVHSGDSVLAVEDGIQLSGFLHRDVPTEFRMRAVPGADTNELAALISYGEKSARVFTRPANPDAPFQGDWIDDGNLNFNVNILHVYAGPFRVAGTFDKISTDLADLGYPLSDFGSNIKTGSLALWLESPFSVHSLEGTLDGPNVLKAQWRGSGSLTEPDFHRLAPGSYPPKAPVGGKAATGTTPTP